MDAQEFITEQNFDPQQLVNLTREELVDKLKEVVENGEITAIKEQVDCIKQLFYKRHQQELAERSAQPEVETEKEDIAEPKQKQADPVEAEFKAVMGIYREKRAAYLAAIDAEYAANLEKKQAIIAKLEALIANEGDLNETIAAFRVLQNEWKEIGPVAKKHSETIWKRFVRHKHCKPLCFGITACQRI